MRKGCAVVRTRNQFELQSLDDELNLFEENEWDFMSVVETHGNNYEYFNDIRDADFEFRKFNITTIIPYASLAVAVLSIMLVVTLKVTNMFDDSEWRELNSIQSVHGGVGVNTVEGGVEATPEELIGVSNALGSYVSYLQAKGDYFALDDACVNSSEFAKKYYECTDSVLTIYDVHDCYARGLREFASQYKIQRINRVIKKGDVYYCYVSAEYPTIYDVSEFVQMHNQSFVLKFQGGYNINEASVAKFLLEVIAENNVPRSVSDMCIQMKDTEQGFKLVDDSFILGVAEDDYNVAVNQVLKSLDSLLTG